MKKLKITDIAVMGLFIALTTVGSKIQLPGPIVPFTAQFFFASFGGALLGAKRGAITQLIYVIMGLLGAPVFSVGAGPAYLLKPTFGYLLGFIFSALIVGLAADYFMRKCGKITFLQLFLSSLAGLFAVYICGVGYYLLIKGVYLNESVQIDSVIFNFVVLFLLTDVMWCFLIALIGPRIRKAVQPFVS